MITAAEKLRETLTLISHDKTTLVHKEVFPCKSELKM